MSASDRNRVFVLVLLFVSAVTSAFADDTPANDAPAKSALPESGLKSGYRSQDSDDLAMPMKPVVPLSAAGQSRNEALSWFMTGRFLDPNHRNEPAKSLNAFRKAIQLDPEAIEIYRTLVPLEFQADNIAAAVRYATKAVQLDPDDYGILELLARQAAISGQLPESIRHFERAVNSPRMSKTSPEYVFLNKDLGILYATTGQREKAADSFEIVFDALKTPEKYGIDSRTRNRMLTSPETAYEKIGQVLLDAKRLKIALEAFEMAAKSAKPGAGGNLSFNRAKILFLSDKSDEALAELQKYFGDQRTTKGREPYQLLDEILAKLNRSDELIHQLEKMADDDSQNVALQFFFADRLADAGELERARTIYDTMLQRGGDVSGYGGLARILRKMQKSDELLEALGRGMARGEDAIATLEPELKALSEDKALMGILLETGRKRAAEKTLTFEEAYLLAKLAAALKDPDSSGQFYRLAIDSNHNPNRPAVLIQIEMAEMYMKLRAYSQAVDTYHEVLESKILLEKGRARFFSLLAQALSHDNRTDEAVEAISEAIKREDDNAGFRFYEAWIYIRARNWDESIRKLEQVMKDFEDEKEVVQLSQFSLSNVYVQKGELQKGEEILEKILEVNPESSQANNDLGYLWADQGKNLERAEKMIRKALAAEPDNGSYLDSLGWVLFKLGKLEDAIEPLEQSVDKISAGGDGTVWDHLGDLFLKMMRTEKAVEAWQTALKHLEDEKTTDTQLLDRIKDKLLQHGPQEQPKPASKGSP